MSRINFSDYVNKLQLLNPEANIMFSSKSTDVIWSEVPAADLVLPPCIESVPGMPFLKFLNFPGGQVQVKEFGDD